MDNFCSQVQRADSAYNLVHLPTEIFLIVIFAHSIHWLWIFLELKAVQNTAVLHFVQATKGCMQNIRKLDGGGGESLTDLLHGSQIETKN